MHLSDKLSKKKAVGIKMKHGIIWNPLKIQLARDIVDSAETMKN